MTAEQVFLRYSADKLTQYSGRISACLDRLQPGQIWARPSGSSNAIGNLVLHLCGNIRQWIVFGVAGQADVRERDAEFASTGGLGSDELKTRLNAAVQECVGIIVAVAPARLTETTRVQGYELTVLEAIYHVTEHFSHHAGQIIFAAKMFTGEDLGFYRHLSQAAHGEKVP